MRKEYLNYFDGSYKPSKECLINCKDLSILRGLGIFEYYRSYNGKVNHIKPYLKRLKTSAKRVGIKLPFKEEDIIKITKKLIKLNYEGDDLCFKLLVLGGKSENYLIPYDDFKLVILVDKHKRLLKLEKGIKLITSKDYSTYLASKTINYIPAIMSLKEAKKRRANDVIYVTRDNKILECTTSNIFIVKGKNLITPKKGVIKGIIRDLVLNKLKIGLKGQERDINLKEIYTADEIFTTSSGKFILPVIKIDNKKIGSGKPGKITKEIREELNSYFLRLNSE